MRDWIFPLLLSMVGCATPTLDASQFRIVEEEYGIYSRMGNTSKISHSKTTSEIPCSTKAIFGADLTLDYLVERKMILPFVAEWRHPEVPGFRPERLRFLPDPFYAIPGSGRAGLQVAVALDDKRDLVNGNYEIVFFNPETKEVYYRRTFVLDSCP